MFHRFATTVSDWFAHPIAFALAVTMIAAWGASGFAVGFSELWHLMINTPTTIITFLAVFLLQNRQKTDTEATHAKLDELIRAIPDADNGLRGIEGV